MFFFYLARCSDESLYAGSCKDIKSREKMHNSGKGAKYTRSRLPIKIIYFEEYKNRSEACIRESAVKKFTKIKKEKLIAKKKN
jgi:putative endonuclease